MKLFKRISLVAALIFASPAMSAGDCDCEHCDHSCEHECDNSCGNC